MKLNLSRGCIDTVLTAEEPYHTIYNTSRCGCHEYVTINIIVYEKRCIQLSYARRGVLFYAVKLSQRKMTRHDEHIKLNADRNFFFYLVT